MRWLGLNRDSTSSRKTGASASIQDRVSLSLSRILAISRNSILRAFSPARFPYAGPIGQCPLYPGEFNRSLQHCSPERSSVALEQFLH
jgi:hypothetical protein